MVKLSIQNILKNKVMEQYIKKSALVEWIKKEDKEMQPNKDWHFDEYTEGYVDALAQILSFIDTLEVKEVDLEKEYKDFIKCNNGRSMFETAKHFYELGLKAAQEGE